ncbi:MAG: redoxin domain-containing protein [Candidatus Eisenbacteria bacterium]|uniref:Redoxin domain-containing protein n=1 Tax=Eiseniibacteriota bacterium TaxID=2212470 RepID=A0A933SCF4_UNCEI|nr:redoxin domain-containing protein [Candidatus Eisenbacteria bacterium]
MTLARSIRRVLACALLAGALVRPAHAVVNPGQAAPAFTKNVLNSNPWPTATLSQFAGKVLVLEILGYDCVFCMTAAPSIETNIWRHYQTVAPGQVQVLGCDVRDGTIAQLNGFRTTTGVTYPLLRDCWGGALNPQNFVNWYGERDNYVVINKQGVVRYRAAQVWPYGNGYHLNELLGCIDSLVTLGLDAEPGARASVEFAAAPNPAREGATLSLALPHAEARLRVSVLDLSGRRVATLADGEAGAGAHEYAWDLRDGAGGRAAPGVYLAEVSAGSWRRTVRLVVVR